jgi:hypothetical protein
MNVPVVLALQNFKHPATGFVGETDKGGGGQSCGSVTPTGDAVPVVTPGAGTIPLRRRRADR